MPTAITRAAFIQCVEAGINRARRCPTGTLKPYQQARLRLVALAATEFTVGCFGDGDCGCPLTQAGMGLDTEYEDQLVGDSALTAFYGGFDPLVRVVTGERLRSRFTVVE